MWAARCECRRLWTGSIRNHRVGAGPTGKMASSRFCKRACGFSYRTSIFNLLRWATYHSARHTRSVPAENRKSLCRSQKHFSGWRPNPNWRMFAGGGESGQQRDVDYPGARDAGAPDRSSRIRFFPEKKNSSYPQGQSKDLKSPVISLESQQHKVSVACRAFGFSKGFSGLASPANMLWRS